MIQIRQLLTGLGLGLGLGLAPSACDVYCSGERGLHSLDGSSGAYHYGFDVDRAPFHDDSALEQGTLELDEAAQRVVIRYPVPGGEKVETWSFDEIVLRSSDDPGT
ncbi:MAG TPA: hypothetical protein ENK18_06810 [Deltaproteobacteria bacterium]|nr:hypothetical protein [Deltaproteobacteria bacterium]